MNAICVTDAINHEATWHPRRNPPTENYGRKFFSHFSTTPCFLDMPNQHHSFQFLLVKVHSLQLPSCSPSDGWASSSQNTLRELMLQARGTRGDSSWWAESLHLWCLRIFSADACLVLATINIFSAFQGFRFDPQKWGGLELRGSIMCIVYHC